MSLYVYALVPAGVEGDFGTGIEEETLRALPLGGISAVIGEIDHRPSIAPATLQAHDEVVRRIARVSDAVLPLRFGAMTIDAGELAEGLRPRVALLAAALERTRGCDQMTLRVYVQQADKPPHPARAESGTDWLKARSASHGAVVERIRDALAPLARAASIESHDTPPLRATLFHLVERARLGEYDARVRALAAAIAPHRVVATGPWPPYAFADLG